MSLDGFDLGGGPRAVQSCATQMKGARITREFLLQLCARITRELLLPVTRWLVVRLGSGLQLAMIRPLASGEWHSCVHDLSAGQLGVERLPHGSDSTTAAFTTCRIFGRLHFGAGGSLEAIRFIHPIDPIDEPQTRHRHSD